MEEKCRESSSGHLVLISLSLLLSQGERTTRSALDASMDDDRISLCALTPFLSSCLMVLSTVSNPSIRFTRWWVKEKCGSDTEAWALKPRSRERATLKSTRTRTRWCDRCVKSQRANLEPTSQAGSLTSFQWHSCERANLSSVTIRV